jgi:aspartyl-tRNA(Asn)/glutamyl-tRNA(Gln) amidotransferase subunit A
VGTLTRTVRDSAVLLGLVAGPDPMDATCSERPGEDYLGAARQGEEDPQGTLAGLRLGLPREAFQEGVDPQVAHTVREAVRAMEREGAQVVEVSLPSLPVALSAYYLVATAEASSNLARFDGVRYGRAVREGDMLATYLASRGEGLGREVKRRILLGTFALSAGYYEAYYQRAQKARFRIRQELLTALAQCHVLVTPTAPDVAFLLGERANDPLAMYAADLLTVPVSLAGFPALSVPAGRVQGLPVGMQLIGPPFSEARLLKVGSAWEALRPWPLPPLMPEDGRGEPS